MDLFVQIVTWARNLRAELGILPKDRIDLYVDSDSSSVRDFLSRQEPLAAALLNVGSFQIGASPIEAVQDRLSGIAVGLVPPQRDFQDGERARLDVEAEKLEQQLGKKRELLSNEQFLAKAPEPVIEQHRSRLAEMEERLESIQAGLASIDKP